MTEMPSVVRHRQVVGKCLGMRWFRPGSDHASFNERRNLGLRNQNTSGFPSELFPVSYSSSRQYWTQKGSTQFAT